MWSGRLAAVITLAPSSSEPKRSRPSPSMPARAAPGDRVDREHRAVGSGHLIQHPDVVHDPGRGLRLGDEHGPRGLREARELLVEATGVDLLAPLEREVDGLGAKGVAELGPPLA